MDNLTNNIVLKEKIPDESEFLIWVEPEDNSEGSYAAIAKLINGNDELLWNEIDLRSATSQDTAIRYKLKAKAFYLSRVMVVFQGDQFKARICHLIIKPDGSIYGDCPSYSAPTSGSIVGRQTVIMKTIQS